MKNFSQRIKSFDVIRVLAMSGVFFYHLNPKVFPFGFLGVVTLFIFAGYLSLHQISIKKPKPIINQLITKWKKLFPPMILMIFIISLLMILLFPNFLNSLGESVRSSVLGINNYQQLFSGDSYFQGQLYLKPFTHLWAIALEIQFYLFFIIFVSKTYSNKTQEKWFLGFIILSILSLIIFMFQVITKPDPTAAYYGFESRLFSFTIGMLAYQLTPLLKGFRYKKLGSLILLLMTILLNFINFNHLVLQLIPYTLLISLLIMLNFWDKTFLKPLSNASIIKYLSSRSYYIYLWHYPIFEMGSRLLVNIKLPTWVYMLLMSVVSLFVSEIAFRIHRKYLSNTKYYLIAFLVSILLLLIPFRSLYELRADEGFKQLEESLTQESVPEYEVPPKPVITQDVITLKPTLTQADFDGTFVSYFNDLNQINSEVNYSFEDFIKYREVPVTLIGDSIAYIAQPHFDSYLPNIITSAEKSRLLEEVDQYYFNLKENNQIQDILVISFGTNSMNETDEGLIKIWEDLKGKPLILLDLVMPYPVNEESRNQLIHNFVETHENVYLASWYDYAKTQPDFFAEDFMHPNDLGSRAFIHLITNEVINVSKDLEASGKLIVE